MENPQTTNSEFINKGHELEVSMVRFIRTHATVAHDEDLTISSILDLDDLKDIMEPFYEMTGLGIGIFDQQNRPVLTVGWQKICSHFHQKHPLSHKACIESEQYFKNNFEQNMAISNKCSNGLWDMAYPIFVDNELIGSIYFGQFFYDTDTIDKEFFLNQAAKYNFDQEAYIELLKKVPILSKQKIDAYIKLFVTIVEKIAKIGKL